VDLHAATASVTKETTGQTKDANVEHNKGMDVGSPPKRTLFSRKYTDESVFKLFFQPVVLLTLPPVLWVTSCTIGFLVVITSNLAPAFEKTYGFTPWQASLCLVGSLIGSTFNIFFGGHFSE